MAPLWQEARWQWRRCSCSPKPNPVSTRLALWRRSRPLCPFPERGVVPTWAGQDEEDEGTAHNRNLGGHLGLPTAPPTLNFRVFQGRGWQAFTQKTLPLSFHLYISVVPCHLWLLVKECTPLLTLAALCRVFGRAHSLDEIAGRLMEQGVLGFKHGSCTCVGERA